MGGHLLLIKYVLHIDAYRVLNVHFNCAKPFYDPFQSRVYFSILIHKESFISSHHRNDGVWAEHPMIYAAADLYGMNIYVTSYRYSETHRYIATSEHPIEDRRRWLHLSHIENIHYNYIERGNYCS